MKKQDAREQLLLKYISSKQVLDLGATGSGDRFLHGFLARHSKGLLGLELKEKRVKKLKAKGFNVVQGDAQNFSLGRKFDVVVAGDLIEHLTNFDGFFEGARKHLKKGGYLIINTPNIYSINRLLRALFGKVRNYEEHTCGFDEDLLTKLASRYSYFKIRELIFFNHKHGGLKNLFIRAFSLINKKFSEHIMIVLERVK